MPSAHKQMGCILHCSGSNSRCSWSRILDSDTKWKSRAPWLPLVCWCTRAKTYAYLCSTANWIEYPSNRDQETSTHGIAEILAGRSEKQYSQLLADTQAWSFQTCTACCRRRPIHNAHQTHSQLINTIDAGVRVQESMRNHITDLIVGANECKNAPFSFTEQATHEECQVICTIHSAHAPSTPQD